jgi:2-polyprenyl-3-methyl-5-hydroxy-6-metoxy-1,4-benzoquinol methylase
MSGILGYEISTIDLDPENNPDFDCKISELEPSDQFDVVCAFEVLEHMPYQSSLEMFQEMARLSKKWTLISVPTKRNSLSVRL